jgi:radical SAM protein with 4Fe4S-binding SPASM domain
MFAEGQRVGREFGVVADLLPGDQFDESAPMPGEAPLIEGARKDCSDFWNKAIITTNGDVLPCCASQKAVGNLLETDFETIWYGKAYSSLRRRFISGDMPEMCKACTGMAWTQGSRMKDVKFYFSDLVARRLRHRLRRNKTARAVYRGIKRVLGRNSAGKQEQSAGEDLHARHEHTAR